MRETTGEPAASDGGTATTVHGARRDCRRQ
jgi:hypothetical protein